MSFSIDRLITSPRYCNTCNKTEHLKRSGTSHRVYYCAQSCQKKDCKAYKKLWPIAKKAIFLKHKRKYTPKSKEQYLSLANLPLDIICHITKHLTPTDVERVSFTCMQFNCKKKKLAAAILTAAPNKKIIDDKLLKIIKLYSNLKYLDLSECCNITDAGLAHLSTLPLQSLNLNWCHNITNTGLAHLSALPLQSLGLSCCSNITDAGLAHLSTLPLQSLNLNWCHNITDTGLAHLSTLPLQSLHVESYYI